MIAMLLGLVAVLAGLAAGGNAIRDNMMRYTTAIDG